MLQILYKQHLNSEKLDLSALLYAFLFSAYQCRSNLSIFRWAKSELRKQEKKNEKKSVIEGREILDLQKSALIVFNEQKILYSNSKASKYFKLDQLEDTFSKCRFNQVQIEQNKLSSSNLYDEIIRRMKKQNDQTISFGLCQFMIKKKIHNFKVSGRIIYHNNEPAMALDLCNITKTLYYERQIWEERYRTLFIRSFSHEVRHPIVMVCSIISSLQLNLSKYQENSAQKFLKILNEDILKIEQETNKLLSLCDQLRDVSDIQSQAFKLQPCKFILESFIKNVLSPFEKIAKKKNIELHCCINPKISKSLYADKQRIKNVMLNLLNNAFKFTKKGFVKVYVDFSTRSADIQLENYNEQEGQNNSLIKFKIIDSGCGIENEKLQYSFDLFGLVKMQNFNLEKAQGNGLGLFLSQKLGLQLGQRKIKLKSKLGKGTQVTFYVRTQTCQKNTKSTLALPELNRNYEFRSFELISEINLDYENISPTKNDFQVQGQKCHCPQILIVDDTEFIRQILIEILSDYSLRQARDGAEALKEIWKLYKRNCCKEFEVIIMDCEMPIMDGWEATRRIRQMMYMGPILGHTAYSNQLDIERCLKAGMNEVIAKPSKPIEIQNAIQRLNQMKNSFEFLNQQLKSLTRKSSLIEMKHNYIQSSNKYKVI